MTTSNLLILSLSVADTVTGINPFFNAVEEILERYCVNEKLTLLMGIPINACAQVGGSKWLSRHVGHQEVSRCYQKSKNRGISGPTMFSKNSFKKFY